MTLPAVEKALSDPIRLAGEAFRRAESIRNASGLAGLLGTARSDLVAPTSGAPAAAPAPAALEPRSGVPPELRDALSAVVAALDRARPALDKAVRSLSPDERETLVSFFVPMLTHQLGPPPDGPLYDAAGRFDAAALLEAAVGAARAVDEAVPRLRDFAGRPEAVPRVRWRREGGDVLISGVWNETFSGADLDRTALLVHFGGSSRYLAPPAAAGRDYLAAGEAGARSGGTSGGFRIVVDFSPNVVVESSGAASGIFGVGLLYLPSAGGAKELAGGDVSLGAGLFGVGGLSVEGPASLRGAGFSEGAGAFGVGLLDVRGAGGVLEAAFASQGFGFTRGAGILRLRGDGARLVCGTSYPDPHEPQAAISLCQGVGFGPRAFAAGGVGVAVVAGDRNELRANYQSQGSGYWHGLGGLAIFGNDNTLQARRYGQGAGVHAAAGTLTIRGDRNKTLHWGVGPAFGWDYGAGVLDARGDDGVYFATWGTGRGDANGCGLASIRGDRNRLSLPDFGSGYLRRFAPGYGLALCEGRGNRYRVSQATAPMSGPLVLSVTPWGALAGDAGLLLDPSLETPNPQWPDVGREPWASRERGFLERLLASADGKRGAERIAGWLSVLGLADLDGRTPAAAALRLLSLDPNDAELLVGRLSLDRFDETIWARTILASYGEAAAVGTIRALAGATGPAKALLLGQLAYAPAADAVEPALRALGDPDWRVRRQAVAVLGYVFGRQAGTETGRLRFLEEALRLCSRSPSAGPLEAATLERIGDKRLGDLYAALALDAGTSAAERSDLFERSPNPFDTLPAESIDAFAKILSARGARCAASLAGELDSARRLSDRAREGLLQAAADADRSVRGAAYGSLGALGRRDDVGVIARGLSDDWSEAREAAALGLGEMGAAARVELERSLRNPSASVRALAALAAAQSSDPEVFRLVHAALGDPDEDVRRAAVAGLAAAQRPTQGLRKEFAPDLARLLRRDPSPSVRATAAALEPVCR